MGIFRKGRKRRHCGVESTVQIWRKINVDKESIMERFVKKDTSHEQLLL